MRRRLRRWRRRLWNRVQDRAWVGVGVGLVLTLAALAGPASASTPDPSAVESGLRVAAAVFGAPSCGTPKVAVLATLGRTDGKIGQARAESCAIELASSHDWAAPEACTLIAHEWGHLALGARFGGADPWHSTDPRSVMYPNPVGLDACYPLVSTPRVKRLRIHRVKWGKGKVRHRRARTLRAVVR